MLINSIDADMHTTNLRNISNVQIPAHCIARIPIKFIGRCITTTSLEVEINGVISIQNPQLVMMLMVHLKDEIQQAQIPLTLVHLSSDVIQITS